MLRVLIVDDSPTARVSLRAALESDPEIRVVAEAATSSQALGQLGRQKIDLVTMDVHLGKESGFDTAERIMEAAPCPILVVTGVNADDPELAFRAVEAGALEIRPKLPSLRSSSYEVERHRLVRAVKALAQVPVVTRKAKRCTERRSPQLGDDLESPARLRAIVIGASTGGPPVLQTLLGSLPTPLICPVVIVQHIFKGFAEGLANWLASTSAHPVVVCKEDLVLQPGSIYLAPGDRHLRYLSPRLLGPCDDPPRHHHRPSVDLLFESAARHLGSDVLAVLLTGMGSDGAEGLSRIQESGGRTIVQEPASCTVDSMPRAALKRNAAHRSMAPAEIVREIERRLDRHATRAG